MTTDLPHDLLAFLRTGRPLEYDVKNSNVGSITLKRDTDLTLSTLETYPGCQSIIDDPYYDLKGLYQPIVCDLVAKSEHYDPAGLLCWIVALQRFGSIDQEHGDVFAFPDATWTQIMVNPLPYLESQWGGVDDFDVAVRVLPWIRFPFKLDGTGALLMPYGSQCPVHGASVTVQQMRKRPAFGVLRKRQLDDWLQKYQTMFPCSGLPVSDDELLCCSDCRVAEEAWIQIIDDSMPPIDVTPNARGFAQCPECGWRFSTADFRVFVDGVHLLCGQRINIVSRSEPAT